MKAYSFVILCVCAWIILYFTACQRAVFAKRHSFANNQWNSKDSITFEPEIKDTNLEYEIILNLRHTQYYECKNIIFSMSITAPNGQMLSYEQFDIPLADNSGRWTGEWIGDIVDQKIILKRNYKFAQAGKYTFRFAQQMRDKEKLHSVMSAELVIKSK
ncbi:MAG: gliding motility lipoprotein GldH [Bacteroidia bacterium]|nr:gliding motility lipoprotein GldH [Bacteroidia bacterium]MDW8302100.1 gliding motility lipoprotein GldH [Bacteroidia bacterium]